MRDKHPIHTTISTDALRVLERYEKEFGAKNTVLERALLGMDKLRFRDKIDAQSVNKMIKRIRTGIPGFDPLIEGGIPEGSILVVTGPPGTGKTTFSLQFLMEGLRNNERCIFFSSEEGADQLIREAARFRWDIGKYIDAGFLEVFGAVTLTPEQIIEIFETFKPKRVVFDSLSVFFDLKDFRRSFQWRIILKEIKKQKITTITITEKMYGLEVKQFDDFDFAGDLLVFLDRERNTANGGNGEEYRFYLDKARMTSRAKECFHSIVAGDNGLHLNGKKHLEQVIEEKISQKERSASHESGTMKSLKEIADKISKDDAETEKQTVPAKKRDVKRSVLTKNMKKIISVLNLAGGILSQIEIAQKTGIGPTNLAGPRGPLTRLEDLEMVEIDKSKKAHIVSLKKTSENSRREETGKEALE